jgi:hypothetical protein
MHTLLDAIRAVPALNRHFPDIDAYRMLRIWDRLPITSQAFYSSLPTVLEAVRYPNKLFAPFSPMSLLHPAFPFTIYQSRLDKEVLRSRVETILASACADRRSVLTIVVNDDSYYFAAEFAELSAKAGYRPHLILGEGLSDSEITEVLIRFAPSVVVWIPWRGLEAVKNVTSVKTLITFNEMRSLPTKLLHIDIAHIDPAPYFAFRIGNHAYLPFREHFWVDSYKGHLLITSLAQDLLPLVRYDSGIVDHLPANFLIPFKPPCL